MADGAVHIDTTPYSLDEVIDHVVASWRAWKHARGPHDPRTGSCPAATGPAAAGGRRTAVGAPVAVAAALREQAGRLSRC